MPLSLSMVGGSRPRQRFFEGMWFLRIHCALNRLDQAILAHAVSRFPEPIDLGSSFQSSRAELLFAVLLHKKRVNILSAVFIIPDDTSVLFLAPLLNRAARKKCHSGSDEVIVKKVPRA